MTHDDPTTTRPARPAGPATPVASGAPDAPITSEPPPAAALGEASQVPIEPIVGTRRSFGASRLRIGIVSGAAVALAVGAVATSLAASPASGSPTAGSTTGSDTNSAWVAPAAITGLVDGEVGVAEHGRFGGHGGFRDITITAISGSTVRLETSDGWTRTVSVTDGVELTKGGQAIELSDLAVGDEIRLRQEIADDGTVTVTGIVVVVPSVAGEVSDLTATGFKLTGRDGSVWTITVTGDTVYRYGAGVGTLADIADGDNVLVQGTASGDNALTATSVTVRGDLAAGTVTATSATSITIEDRTGDSVTIHVDADTTYRAPGDDEASLADIAVDDVIVVSGRARDDGSIDADVVMEGGRGIRPGVGGGHGWPGGPGFPDGPGRRGPNDVEDRATDAG